MKSLFLKAIVFFLGTALVLGSGAMPAVAATPQTVLTYQVYAGGLHATDARLTLRLDSKSYDASLTAATAGILESVARWSGSFSTSGKIVKGVMNPVEHRSASTWKDKTETKVFRYNGKGGFVSYRVAENGADKTPKDVDVTLAKGTKDNLSATFQLMTAMTKTRKCDANSLIFDGDRSYRLKFAGSQSVVLEKNAYNAYAGPAVACTVEVVPEKGKWRKKPRGWLTLQEQGRQKGALPTVWFAHIAGQDKFFVPVKIMVKTDYGTLFMHLTSAKTK